MANERILHSSSCFNFKRTKNPYKIYVCCQKSKNILITRTTFFLATEF